MRKAACNTLCLCLLLLILAGCGGGTASTPPPGPQSAAVTLSMTDAPPVGVSVLSFEVSLTGAVLNPGNVDLLGGKGPVRVEVKKLETEGAFLSTANVTPGNYTSLNLAFANPELTFMNGTGAALAGCAPGAVCEIKPGGTFTATVSNTFVVSSGAQSGLLVDVNLANLLTSTLGVDFSGSGAVTVQEQTKKGQGELEDLDDVDGILKSPANNQFTLQTMDMGTLTVSVDSNTEFKDFANCQAANFSCLQDGMSIEADLLVMASGSFLAKKIELHDDVAGAADDQLDGVVSKVDSATQFEIVVVDELRSVTNVSVGDPVTVILSTGASFQVDNNGLNVPSTLSQAFQNATDTSQLLLGQTVQVRKRSTIGGPAPAPITVTTDRVRLRDTRFTAVVSGAPTGSAFNVGTLPALFTAAGISQIQVQTSSQTNFENANGVADLSSGSTVSLRGLLFVSSPNPVLIADKVRKR